ncbi:MAG: tetratricopeptide repeat protein [Xanthomonadaceae bacterium]|nr:tetratricopeptide repeat protein [Xanthomonadaceae bacterium]
MILRKSTAFGLLLALWLPSAARADVADAEAARMLQSLLVGEFSLQQGNYAAAAQPYVEAAERTTDPAVAQRASAVAAAANDDVLLQRALARWQALAPQSEALLDARTSLALRQGDDAAVVAALTQRMAGSAEGWRDAVKILAGRAEPDRVAGIIDQLMRREALPSDLTAWLAFAGVAQRIGRDALVERLVDTLVARFPDAPRAWLLKAGRLREQGDATAARTAVEQALAHVREDAGLRFAAAAELSRLGDPAAAAAALAIGEQDEQTLRARAGFLSTAKDQAGLDALYAQARELRRGKPDDDWSLLLGQLAETLERYDEALDWYRAVAGGETRAKAQVRIAVALNAGGDFTAAMKQLAAVQADPLIDGEAQRDSFLLEAGLRGEADGVAQEIATLGRGLAVFEDDPALLYARALAHERSDRLDAAEDDFRRILMLDPDNVAALNALGYTLADRTERLDEALNLIERAYDKEPDNAAIVDSLGWVLYRLGRVDDALVHLQRAAKLAPDAEVLAHLAQALWRGNAHDEARQVLARAAALDPDSRAVKRAAEVMAP